MAFRYLYRKETVSHIVPQIKVNYEVERHNCLLLKAWISE